MKKFSVIFFLFALFTITTLKAQSYIGYLSDNYSGIHGVISNPANIADSRFRTDINLIGASAFAGNDYVGIDFSKLINDINYDIDESGTLKEDNNFFGNADILGPAFMFNINDKSSVALFTRIRLFGNILGINGKLYENFSEDFGDGNDFTVDKNDFNISTNVWSEVGATYARELMSKGEHYLKGGVSLKYLQGYVNAYFKADGVSVDYDADGTSPTDGSITTTGTVSYGTSDLDQVQDAGVVGTGFGADLGVVYEWRPDYNGDPKIDKDLNKYKLKLGFSITDFGSIKYKNGEERVYDLDDTQSETVLDNAGDTDDQLGLYTVLSSTTTTKALLPMAAHLDGDYLFKENFYLNLSTTFSLISKTKVNASSVRNRISLTPRYESKWFSFYSPISVYEYSGFQWGAGLRAGPLYFGSGSVLSLLISDNSKAADAYAGLKVPIYHNRAKDRDGDGVFDKVDNCKNEAGPAENDGCPWPDTDEDGVFDKDDKCPKEKGEAANNGCPWGDKDGDTLLDNVDGCPDEAGAVENNGCPEKDSDGDGLLDKDDKCPNEAGPVANDGCNSRSSGYPKRLCKNDII